MKLTRKKNRFNQAQLKSTTNLLLEVTKAVILVIVLGVLFPKISGKIELIGIIIGVLVAITTYLLAIIILSKVRIYG